MTQSTNLRTNLRTNPLDLTVQITTPENIRFDYRLAGPFRRAPALFIDFLVRAGIFFGLYIIVGIFAGIGFRFLTSFLIMGLILLWFLFTWFYSAFLESWRNGQTVGKMAMGIRVISVDGRPINAVQATLRSFIRAADTAPLLSLEWFSSDAPPAYVIPIFTAGILCMMLNSRMQRLGDLAAGTMVVIDEATYQARPAKLEDPRVAALASYIPVGFRMSRSMSQTIALYVDRRAMLTPERRAELAKILADPLMLKFGFRLDTSTDLFLCALYYREFIAPMEPEKMESARGPSPLLADQVPLVPIAGAVNPMEAIPVGPANDEWSLNHENR